MKTTTLLVSALLVTGFALALGPAAEARGVCTDVIDAGCDSAACVGEVCSRDLNPVCVREPCPQPIP